VSQQINLYSPLFRKRKKLFTSRAMLQALVIVLMGLGAFYGYARYQVVALKEQVAESDRQLKAGLERVKAIPAAATPGDEKILDARIAELGAQLHANEQLISQVAASHAGANYVAPLRALARHRLEGVWLTAVTLTGESGELSLVGKALRAELVPRYIDRLAQDPALRGRRFSTLSVERDGAAKSSPDAEAIGFRLMASPEGGS